MKLEYETPNLRLAGNAKAVVLGSLVTGADIGSQSMFEDSEFETDELNSSI